jgi:hypothetical protein
MKITDDMLYSSAPNAERLWLDTLPTREELLEHQFSKGFEKKMKKLIRSQHRSPGLNRLLSASKRIAVIALAILTVSFSCLMCVEAYREKFIEVVSEIFEEFTQFSFSSSRTENTELDEITFDYLPEGMIEIDRDFNPQTHYQAICFEDAMGQALEITQDIIASGKHATIILDTEGAEVTKIDFDGYDATLVVKGEYTTLLCVDDSSYILLSGDFPPEEIIKIANGVNILNK